jgi:hypothetical protein
MPKSTILVEEITRQRLKKIGRKDQTYDDILNQLIDIKMNTGHSNDHRTGQSESSESDNFIGADVNE